MRTSAPLEPGNVVLGRYRIAHSLGAGGMGVVYLAERLSDGTKVVIKTVHDHLAHEVEMRRRFLREAKATQALKHPNVVHVIEASADPLLLVLEHVAGRSLHEHLRQGPLPEADVVSIGVQLLDALDAAHRAKLIHRDLKPGNVMVLEGNRVKLLDFGISRMVDEARHTKLTQTGQILGTPGYLAPEQALAHPVDARTDLYSLGVLMFRALTGRLPFEGRAASLLRAVVEDQPHPLPKLRPNVDPNLATVVHRAMQKDPSARFQSAREMRQALSGPRSKSRWVWVAAIAGILTALLTIGVLSLLNGEDAEPLALRPVAPIESIALATPPTEPEDDTEIDVGTELEPEVGTEVEPEAETDVEPEAEPRIERGQRPVSERRTEPDPEPERLMRSQHWQPFDVEFPNPVTRNAMGRWWREHRAHLATCFSSITSSEMRTWSVTFDHRGRVIALAAGGAPFYVTSCALRAVERPPLAPATLFRVEETFRVRWNPP